MSLLDRMFGWIFPDPPAQTPDKSSGSSSMCYQNTDREVWREPKGDYYGNSVHITEDGRLGINVGGHVIVMKPEAWHRLAFQKRSIHEPQHAASSKLDQRKGASPHKPGGWEA